MPPIKGIQLVLLTIAVSLGIFMNVLDTSIANVAVPTIAGNLGVSAEQGTWVITSFAVSMAIMLPLTGWLAGRLGEVRCFVGSMIVFTLASMLCGSSNSLAMLIVFRVVQGAAAGPMIALSQSLLLANYPPEKKGLATGLWSMVAVVAPVIGPILGGYITDTYTWPWIFYINIPVGIASAYFTWTILAKRETAIVKKPVDYIGLLLLAVGVGCLQILLDKGKDLDWFNSSTIITLAIISSVSLIYFVAWELTEKHPIVDLTLFKRRNFTIGSMAISFGYMTFFGSMVILPLWLQTQMGYTPTWAGLAVAPIGLIPFLVSPFFGRIMDKVDLRVLVSFGFLIFAFCSFWMAHFNTNIGFNNITLIRFIQGIGVPCFFIPLISIILSGLPDNRIASASGLFNFLRILAGSFGTSVSVTLWAHRESVHQSQIVETVTTYTPNLPDVIAKLQGMGFIGKMSYAEIYELVLNQAYMLATDDVFWLSGFVFLILAFVIWFARPPFLSGPARGME